MLRHIVLIWLASTALVWLIWAAVNRNVSYDPMAEGWRACAIGTYPVREGPNHWICYTERPHGRR